MLDVSTTLILSPVDNVAILTARMPEGARPLGVGVPLAAPVSAGHKIARQVIAQGTAAEGGAAPLTVVYRYAEQVTSFGFVFMDTPGYDPVSATGQIAGGARIVVFTTGRGSAFGSKPAPTIKVATNDRLYAQMPDDMDINCGAIVSAGVSIQDKGRIILDMVLRIASGECTKCEALGLGDNEFVPW